MSKEFLLWIVNCNGVCYIFIIDFRINYIKTFKLWMLFQIGRGCSWVGEIYSGWGCGWGSGGFGAGEELGLKFCYNSLEDNINFVSSLLYGI